MTPLLVALTLLGIMLTHFHISLGVIYALAGFGCLLVIVAGGALKRRRLRASPLGEVESALVSAALTMVLSASVTVAWKLFGG